ncbi:MULTISPECIES: fimbrial protein [Enterobacterales]|uniref:fimbrial protein n=1 Tax=Enterobacterales TaxID=91347 RepID=UPI002ED89442
MKKIFISTLIAGALFSAGNRVALADMSLPDDGTVTLNVTVSATSCSVTNDTRDQSVDMGTITRGTLTAKGSESARVPFTIKLVDCPAAVTSVGFTTAGVTHGSADADDATLFAFDPTSSGKGAGIAIYDAATGGNQISPGAAATATYPVTSGAANIALSAAVRQSADVLVGGNFTSVVGFSIVYN